VVAVRAWPVRHLVAHGTVRFFQIRFTVFRPEFRLAFSRPWEFSY
jgi:hypothetical protein